MHSSEVVGSLIQSLQPQQPSVVFWCSRIPDVTAIGHLTIIYLFLASVLLQIHGTNKNLGTKGYQNSISKF